MYADPILEVSGSQAIARPNHLEGLLRYRLWAPPLEFLIHTWSGVPETAFLANSQELRMLFVRGPRFENRCSGSSVAHICDSGEAIATGQGRQERQ